jgi:20S proteasome subunit beta 1
MAGIIIGGWDPYKGGQVFEIPLGGLLMPLPYAIGGSGSSYIYGLMDAEYREGMSKDECKAFVKKCVSHAMARDGSSGGVVRMVVIDKDGFERSCTSGNDLPYMPGSNKDW